MTTPFVGPGAGLTVLAGALVVLLAAATRRPPMGATGSEGAGERRQPSVAAWAIVVAVAVLFELATYVAGEVASRHAFPTVSSLYDAAARVRAVKAAVAATWLALGWALLRRRPAAPPGR